MKKRVFVVHGWDGYPEEGWFPWLKRELESRGFEVHIPQLPDAKYPKLEKWTPALAEAVGKADEYTYFVGHSMGTKTIIKYLEGLPEGTKIGGVVFVAGFLKRLTGLEDDPEVHEYAGNWLEAPVDLEKARSHFEKSTAIFSDNDHYVPLDNVDDFRDKLGSKILIEHNMDHFSGSVGVTELPIALQSLLEIA